MWGTGAGLTGVVGAVVGVVVVGGGAVGLVVGGLVVAGGLVVTVGLLVLGGGGATVTWVGGVLVVIWMFGWTRSTIWFAGPVGVTVPTGIEGVVTPGVVAVGNEVGVVVTLAPGAGVLSRGIVGTFCVG